MVWLRYLSDRRLLVILLTSNKSVGKSCMPYNNYCKSTMHIFKHTNIVKYTCFIYARVYYSLKEMPIYK